MLFIKNNKFYSGSLCFYKLVQFLSVRASPPEYSMFVVNVKFNIVSRARKTLKNQHTRASATLNNIKIYFMNI